MIHGISHYTNVKQQCAIKSQHPDVPTIPKQPYEPNTYSPHSFQFLFNFSSKGKGAVGEDFQTKVTEFSWITTRKFSLLF
jgi:hypothetical protein